MTSIVDELTLRARELPAEDRVRLAEGVLATLHEGTDPDVDAAWDAEIKRRLDEVEAGTVKLVPAEEVIAELRRLVR